MVILVVVTFLFPDLMGAYLKFLDLTANFAIILITFTKLELLLCNADLLRVIINRCWPHPTIFLYLSKMIMVAFGLISTTVVPSIVWPFWPVSSCSQDIINHLVWQCA